MALHDRTLTGRKLIRVWQYIEKECAAYGIHENNNPLNYDAEGLVGGVSIALDDVRPPSARVKLLHGAILSAIAALLELDVQSDGLRDLSERLIPAGEPWARPQQWQLIVLPDFWAAMTHKLAMHEQTLLWLHVDIMRSRYVSATAT